MDPPNDKPTIEATRQISAPPPEVFAFLADLENHWRLAGGLVEVVSLERPGPGEPAHGGVVRLRGPAGVHRTALTRVVAATAPSEMYGSARLGRRTEARVSWTLAGRGPATEVRLAAWVLAASPLDRTLLAVGGRRWMVHLFAGALARLEQQFAARPARSAGSAPAASA